MESEFIPELILNNLEVKDKEEAIKILGKKLFESGFTSQNYTEKVIEREKEYPTGLQTKSLAIAIPHATDSGIIGNHVAIGILKNSVKFHNMEDFDSLVDVKVIFMLAISNAHQQLEMLKILMRIFSEETLLPRLVKIESKEEICEYLNRYIKEEEP